MISQPICNSKPLSANQCNARVAGGQAVGVCSRAHNPRNIGQALESPVKPGCFYIYQFGVSLLRIVSLYATNYTKVPSKLLISLKEA